MSDDRVWLFPGQGAQQVGMGARLYEQTPLFREAFDAAITTAQEGLDCDLKALILAGDPRPELLTQTRYAQPALFAVEYALGRLLLSLGRHPAALLGHSVGEFAAATLAGVFTVDTASRLVALRGRLMQSMPQGNMLAVAAAPSKLEPLLTDGIEIAAYNAPELTVVGGESSVISEFVEELKRHQLRAFAVDTSHAFHTRSMGAAGDRFREAIAAETLNEPRLPLIACAAGVRMDAATAVNPDYWAEQIRRPVRFAQSVGMLVTEGLLDYWEVGPGRSLSGNARRAGAGECLPLMPSGDETLEQVLSVAVVKRPAAEPAPKVEPDGTADLESEVAQLIGEFVGEAPAGSDRSASFTDLGLDSLLLTQIATAIRRRFGVALKYRRLLEDLTSVQVLAQWLQPHAEATAGPSDPRPRRGAPAEEEVEAAQVTTPFGAQAKIEREHASELTRDQRRAIQEFTARYTEATAKSKTFTQTHRGAMADPRAVSGFNPLWKELVYPIVVDRSGGCRVWDIDGNEYIDVVSGFGSTYLGYQPDYITDALKDQIDRGYELGPQHPLTAEVTGLIREITGVDRVAFCNTGSEAVMGAMRCARTVTGRDLIVIFTDSYHGIFDEVIVRGTPTLRSIAAAPGILANAVENVLVLRYGSEESLAVIRERADELAAVMVEPIQRRNPTLQPREFLHHLRDITDEAGAALIFDEIITGFRVALGGAQEYFGVQADLVTYGKVIGGGLPLAAIAGRRRWMDALDGGHWAFGDASVPEAGVTYFAGTFVRHPLALSAAKAALTRLKQAGPGLLETVNARVTQFVSQLNALFQELQAPVSADHFSTIVRIVIDPDELLGPMLYFYLREAGVHIYEGFGMFLGAAHTQADLDALLARWRRAVTAVMSDGLLGARSTEQRDDTQFALTSMQQEIWLACAVDERLNDAYRETFVLRLRGSAETHRLVAAADAALARHEALHVTYPREGRTQIRRAPRRNLVATEVAEQVAPEKREAWLDERGRALRDRAIDLSQDPAFLAEIVRFDDDDHALIFSAHHLSYDGWSENILLEEFAAAYRAIVAAQAPPWRAAPLYSQYAHARAERAATGDGLAQRAYWRSLYANPPEPLELPVDRARPAERSYQAGYLELEFEPDAVAALRALARRYRATEYGVLLASYGLLLARLSGQRDLVVGIPIAGQADSEFEYVVGHCVSLLPIRMTLPESVAVPEWIESVARQLLDAREHGDVSYGELLESIAVARDSRRPTLVAATLNVDPQLAPLRVGELRSELRHVPAAAMNEELKTSVLTVDERRVVQVAYSAALLDQRTIARWMGHWQTLLINMHRSDSHDVWRLPLMRDAERAATAALGSGPTLELPFANLVHMLTHGMDGPAGDRRALVWDRGRHELTYGALRARVDQIAAALQRQHPEGRVGVCLPRGIDHVVALLAILRAGGVYVALDPVNPPARLRRMIEDAGVHFVIGPDSESVAPGVDIPTQPLAALTVEPRDAPPEPAPDGDAPAIVLFTSGSTGEPKPVALTHRNWVCRLAGEIHARPPRDDDTIMIKSSPSFDVFAWEVLRAISSGMAGWILGDGSDADADAILDEVQRGRLTIMHSPPSMLRVLLERPGAREKVATLTELTTGGERTEASLVTAVHRVLGLPLCVRYGPAEATVHITEWISNPDTFSGVVPVGALEPNCRVTIVDPRGEPQPPGLVGEIVIGGAQVASGYLGPAGARTDAFRRGPFHAKGEPLEYFTGDLGWLDADGLLHFVSRKDQQIKLRGQRVEPGEVEAALLTHPHVDEAAVVAVGRGIDLQLSAFYVSPAGVDSHDLRVHLGDLIPAFMIPTQLTAIEVMPRTASGKIDRKGLVETAARPAERTVGTAPQGPTEAFVADVWSELLAQPEIWREDDFFAIGGHSLLAFEAITQVRERLDMEIPLRVIFEHPTLETFAREVERRLEASVAQLSDDEVRAALTDLT